MTTDRFWKVCCGWMLLLCWQTQATLAQNRSSFHITHAKRFQFVADYQFTGAKEVGRELETLAQRLWSELMIPDRRTPVRVYLFSSQTAFSAYVRQHIPTLRQADTNRTAMFLLRNGKPYIFAVATPELTLNLRHEFVHVLLNTTHDRLPIWLDEGIAEYYEVEDGEQVEFRKLLARQNRFFWKPSIARLERLKTMSQLGVVEYAEGWSWVRLLMRGPKPLQQIIPRYLADLRKGVATSSLAERIAAARIDAVGSWNAQYRVARKVARAPDRGS